MCGIIGYVGPQDAVPILLGGLRALEYRGYDSSGVVVAHDGKLETVRAAGKLDRLFERLADHPLTGQLGLGHTRWATHGAPTEKNAHPHLDARSRLAVIHNGIIENFLPLKRRLQAAGWVFRSDTDTEVVANLISHHLDSKPELAAAVAATLREIEGMFAFAVIGLDVQGEPTGEILAARRGPPLVLGVGHGEQFLGSDPAALLRHTRDIVFLENGDLARLTRSGITVWGRDGEVVQRPVQRLNWDPIQTEKGGYKHFMLKEIHEQPQALQDTFGARVDFEERTLLLEGFEALGAELAQASRIVIVACGTSWHAGLVGKFLIETLARIPVEVDYGSEFRYRDPLVDAKVLVLGISQSGETADTLSALEAAREKGAPVVAISNVMGSSVTRISRATFYTHAGPEIGVASTKAFTTQLVALYLFALYLRQVRGLSIAEEYLAALAALPGAVDAALANESHIEELARRYHRAEDFLYLGRGINYPIALEGALKLKEISYIHAEGYPAGEMKHGPIALIDDELPVVAIATGHGVDYDKVRSNLQEVKARGGIALVVTDRDPAELGTTVDEVIRVPSLHPLLQPIVNVVPLQQLAYFIGVRRGADVDQPRNLAKSVTVE